MKKTDRQQPASGSNSSPSSIGVVVHVQRLEHDCAPEAVTSNHILHLRFKRHQKIAHLPPAIFSVNARDQLVESGLVLVDLGDV